MQSWYLRILILIMFCSNKTFQLSFFCCSNSSRCVSKTHQHFTSRTGGPTGHPLYALPANGAPPSALLFHSKLLLFRKPLTTSKSSFETARTPSPSPADWRETSKKKPTNHIQNINIINFRCISLMYNTKCIRFNHYHVISYCSCVFRCWWWETERYTR